MSGMNQIAEGFLLNPVSFCGGFVAGMLRLNIHEDPLRGWLEEQGVAVSDYHDDLSASSTNGSKGPQSISID